MPESIFELEEFKRYKAPFEARVQAFERLEIYYVGTQYKHWLNGFQMFAPRLYKGIKALYLPLHRAVDVMSGLIPGRWILTEEAEAQFGSAVRQVLRWSHWRTEGVLLPHFGAQLGQAVLRVADLRDAQQVVIRPVNPKETMLVPAGEYDPTPGLALTVREIDPPVGSQTDRSKAEYAEVVTPTEIRTFLDGQEYGFDGRDTMYVNELEFVPFVDVQHKNVGKALGEATFERVIPLLDEVNELASRLASSIEKHVDAQWAVIGAEPSEMEKGADKVWFMPMGSEVKAIVAGLDIAGTLAFVQDVKQEMRDALPELGYDALKGASQIATATVEIQLGELVIKVNRVRPNYDQGLADALRLAGRAAATMGLSEIAVLDDETLAFDEMRDVLPRDEHQRLQLEQDRLMLEQMSRGLTGS